MKFEMPERLRQLGGQLRTDQTDREFRQVAVLFQHKAKIGLDLVELLAFCCWQSCRHSAKNESNYLKFCELHVSYQYEI